MPTRLFRLILAATAVTAACSATPDDGPPADEGVASTAHALGGVTLESVTREPLVDDVAHYTTVLRVGTAPHALLTVHRVVREHQPWIPRHAPHGVLLHHGDFSSFTGNFLLSEHSPDTPADHTLAVHLAKRGVDVWGMSRRWTTASPEETDFSDFGAMTIQAAIDDSEIAIGYARLTRGLTGSGFGKIAVGGFSSGGFLAYQVAAHETSLPAWQRQIDALMPIDTYTHIAPEDEDLRLAACVRRDEEQFFIDEGFTWGENGFFVLIGDLVRSDPDGISPINPSRTNRGVMLNIAGRTWNVFLVSPRYHLAGAEQDGDVATAFRWSPELRLADWFSAAPFFQSMAESAEADAFQCGEAPLPFPDRIADIEVPVLYVAAAGGYGVYGLYTLGLVASDDTSVLMVQRLDDADVAEDYGHGDLLYGTDAPDLAWEGMADWLLDH